MFKPVKKLTFKEVPEALYAITRKVVADVLNLDDYRGRRGRKGNVGSIGEQGPEGPPGRPGLDGIDGAIGSTGDVGRTGNDGPRGKVGPVGDQGRAGEVGPAGPPGAKGDPGPIPRHKWNGSKLSFEDPDGKFSRAVDLKGPGGGRGASAKTQYGSISLNGTDLEFKKLGAMGPDTIVDLSSLAGGGSGEVNNAQRVDEVGDTIYIGDAVPGTLDANALWRIKRVVFTKTGSDTDSVTTWANGSETRDRVWTNRLAETYS